MPWPENGKENAPIPPLFGLLLETVFHSSERARLEVPFNLNEFGILARNCAILLQSREDFSRIVDDRVAQRFTLK